MPLKVVREPRELAPHRARWFAVRAERQALEQLLQVFHRIGHDTVLATQLVEHRRKLGPALFHVPESNVLARMMRAQRTTKRKTTRAKGLAKRGRRSRGWIVQVVVDAGAHLRQLAAQLVAYARQLSAERCVWRRGLVIGHWLDSSAILHWID